MEKNHVIRWKHLIQPNSCRCLFLDLLLIGWRGYANVMGVVKLLTSCSIPKIITQSIYKLVHMQWSSFRYQSFQTVDRSSIMTMTRIQRRSMVIYGSLQAEFMGSRYSGHIHKNIERYIAHTIVSLPKPKRWVIVRTSVLMMIIRQSICILSIIATEMGKLKTRSPAYCIIDNWQNMLYLTQILDKIYLRGI